MAVCQDLAELQFELSLARAGVQYESAEKLYYKERALRAESRLMDVELNAALARSSDHLDRFFAHPCKAKLAPFFPNAKEVTETFGAFHAVKQYLPHIRQGDPKVSVIVVGDGHSPRTGLLFALSSAWDVYSVDPAMRLKYRGLHDRLMLANMKIEDVVGWSSLVDRRVLIVAVHSHAELKHAITKVRGCAGMDVVSIPCCVPQWVPYLDPSGAQTVVPVPPTIVYEDPAILSPERRVKVWRNVHEVLRDPDALARAQGVT
jgi:hypothetical protein